LGSNIHTGGYGANDFGVFIEENELHKTLWKPLLPSLIYNTYLVEKVTDNLGSRIRLFPLAPSADGATEFCWLVLYAWLAFERDVIEK